MKYRLDASVLARCREKKGRPRERAREASLSGEVEAEQNINTDGRRAFQGPGQRVQRSRGTSMHHMLEEWRGGEGSWSEEGGTREKGAKPKK